MNRIVALFELVGFRMSVYTARKNTENKKLLQTTAENTQGKFCLLKSGYPYLV